MVAFELLPFCDVSRGEVLRPGELWETGGHVGVAIMVPSDPGL